MREEVKEVAEWIESAAAGYGQWDDVPITADSLRGWAERLRAALSTQEQVTNNSTKEQTMEITAQFKVHSRTETESQEKEYVLVPLAVEDVVEDREAVWREAAAAAVEDLATRIAIQAGLGAGETEACVVAAIREVDRVRRGAEDREAGEVVAYRFRLIPQKADPEIMPWSYTEGPALPPADDGWEIQALGLVSTPPSPEGADNG